MKEICQYKSTERLGLYIMVFFILINTCSMDKDHRKIKEEISHIKQELVNKPVEQTGGQRRSQQVMRSFAKRPIVK